MLKTPRLFMKAGFFIEAMVSGYYVKTKNFTPYKTLQDRIKSGGRMSKK